ncbi:L-threonylcarbamoyladenylate synthase [Aestuariispira ectoiniformans]|uniref:L-threonylcarbamoyladenylate synthase n=1 Tax=Aestuariispira ectoiniformans TaxID=2775080 RepID=UPI00223A9030|nr:L-threonylcarbamoyladenylate synthase [Aestuariispira ectoiniformans]
MPDTTPILSTSGPFLERAVQVLSEGGLVITPSVTNYILVCDATNRDAVRRVFDVKKRRQTGPLSVALPDTSDIGQYVHIPDWVSQYALDSLFPGEIAMIFRHKYPFPRELVSGLPTLAITISSDRNFGPLVKEYGKPLAGTSANISGQGNIFVSLDKAMEDIGDKVDLILDGGPTVAQAFAEHTDRVNTLVDFTQGEPWLVRKGWVPVEKIQQFFPNLNLDTDAYSAGFEERVNSVVTAVNDSPAMLQTHE